MARSTEECARLIVETLRTELGDLVQVVFKMKANPENPESETSLGRFKQQVLSGNTPGAQAFIESGISVGFSDAWLDKLSPVGITREELERAGFLNQLNAFSAADVVAANGRHQDLMGKR